MHKARGEIAAISLAGILVMSILLFSGRSVFADGFNITTSRSIYSPSEKILVLGTVPENSTAGVPVLISILADDGTVCNTGTVLPSDDGNFISRPIEMSGCALGHYEVKASYGSLAASASFSVSAIGKLDQASMLEIRIIKSIVNESQDLANLKVQDLLRTGQDLSPELAAKYQQGIAESSAAIRSAEFGDRDAARTYMVAATGDFHAVILQLSAEESKIGQTSYVSQGNDTSSSFLDAKETISRLSHYADWLNQLAAKNGSQNDTRFGSVSNLLGQASGLLGTGDIQGARDKMSQVSTILESVRMDLMNKASAAVANSTLSSVSSDNITKTKLSAFSKVIERRANLLLNQSIPKPARDLLEQTLSLVGQARTDLDNGDLHVAKKTLANAFTDLSDAIKIIENSHDR